MKRKILLVTLQWICRLSWLITFGMFLYMVAYMIALPHLIKETQTVYQLLAVMKYGEHQSLCTVVVGFVFLVSFGWYAWLVREET